MTAGLTRDQIAGELAARRLALLIEAACRPDGLAAFCRLLWPVIEPKRPLVWSWHMDAICDDLMASYRGELDTDEWVGNIPPRHSKSSLVSVLGPAWLWLRRSEAQFLCLTKSEKNAARDARLMRRVLLSAQYLDLKSRMGATWTLSTDQNRLDYYANTDGGHRVSLTTNSAMTGAGADFLIIDDPHDAKDMLGSPEQVKRELDRVWEQYNEVWTSRLNPGQIGGQVQLIMQRLHEADLAGRLLARDAASLCLPMLAEPSHDHAWEGDPRKEGEVLAPARFGAPELHKAQQSPTKWAGQYQQRPAPREGGLFKVKWFQNRWTPATLPELAGLLLSIDATFKDTKQSDFCAIGTWGRVRSPVGAVLLDQLLQRMDYPTLKVAVLQAIASAHARWPGLPLVVLIEDKANGSALIADIRKSIPGVVPFNPGSKSKYERAQVGSVPWFQAGQVQLPDDSVAGWVRHYIVECASFPNATHDDQVDQTSQALIYMAQHPINNGRTRHGGSRRNLSENQRPEGRGPGSDPPRKRRGRRGGW